MHSFTCPEWDYSTDPINVALVTDRCKFFLISLRTGVVDLDKAPCDTRTFHFAMFLNTTPPECPYFAGHYRGEKFKCLQFYEVEIKSDSRVGVSVAHLSIDLANLANHIIKLGFNNLKIANALPDAQLPPEEKLYYLVVFACKVLVEFLRIHPYANGNGHMGRLIIWIILAKFGYWPRKWPLHESPPYHDLLKLYRDGNQNPLEQFVMRCIAG